MYERIELTRQGSFLEEVGLVDKLIATCPKCSFDMTFVVPPPSIIKHCPKCAQVRRRRFFFLLESTSYIYLRFKTHTHTQAVSLPRMNPLPYRRRLQCIEGGSTRRKPKDETKRDNNLDEKLLLAVQNHDATEVHKLLNEGADPNVPDTSQVSSYPVHWCACSDQMGSHHEVLEVLITKGGADVNVKNTKGQTPAMLASASGKLEILQMLYAAGADFRIATPQGFNVVHFAAQNGHTSLLSFFRNCHLSLDDIDKDGRTTLHWATYNGHRRAVEWLIEVGGVDVLCCDDEKCMPIHWAALQGNFRLAKVLLKHGDALKQLRAKECSGLTPYQLAVDKAGRVDRHKKMMFEKLSKNLKQLESEISRWHFMSKSLINWGCMGGVGGYGFWGLALFEWFISYYLYLGEGMMTTTGHRFIVTMVFAVST